MCYVILSLRNDIVLVVDSMEIKECFKALGIAALASAVTWLVTRRVDKSDCPPSELSKVPGEVRMALVVRSDIPMLKGKAAAQCAHAAVDLYVKMSTADKEGYDPVVLDRWRRGGQAKITLKGGDLESMEELMAIAMSLGVNCTLIFDAGRTQLAENTATVLGLGPAPREVLDQITGELKLF